MATILQMLFPCLRCGDEVDDQTTIVSRYDGERNCLGQKHGYGEYMFPTGDIYRGCWKYNKIHGYGVYTYASGQTQDGFYRDGIFIGEQCPRIVPSGEDVRPQPFPQTCKCDKEERAYREQKRINWERRKTERVKRQKKREEFYQKYPNAKRRVKEYGATQVT